MAQVALAWTMGKEGEFALQAKSCKFFIMYGLGVCAPIIGTTSLENLKDLIGIIIVEACTCQYSRCFRRCSCKPF